jgi:hypothetical protein
MPLSDRFFSKTYRTGGVGGSGRKLRLRRVLVPAKAQRREDVAPAAKQRFQLTSRLLASREDEMGLRPAQRLRAFASLREI